MLFKRKASLSWWRFAGGMVFALLPLAFILLVLKREDHPFGIALLFIAAFAVGYMALRWHQIRTQFRGDADAAAAATRQNPFGLVFGSPRTFILFALVIPPVIMVALIAWTLWNKLH